MTARAPSATGVEPMPRAAAVSPWIVNPVRDLLLFVAPPLFIAPLVWLACKRWTPETLYPIAAFGALGHHLPGMMRAYGDRELFARFKTRFVAAPLSFIGICVISSILDPRMTAITLATYVWGIWHGAMQTHGFLRIYSAKTGSSSRWMAALDQAMCITWFGVGVLWSQAALYHIAQLCAGSGGPVMEARFVHGARTAWAVVTSAVTAAYIVHTLSAARARRRPAVVKLLLLSTTVFYWLYANLVVGNLLIAVVLFELFHDVQYLSIVWVFNRRRVESGSRVDAFTRFVFRNRVPMVLLYVGCVFAYGALPYVPDPPSQALTQVFAAVIAASALLHFYYDSFIWKVRERGTRAGLGLAGGAAERPLLLAPRAWGFSALRWSALVLPLLLLAVGHVRGTVTLEQKMLALGGEFPDVPLAQHNMAVALAADGQTEAAIGVTRRVLTMETFDRGLQADARTNLSHFLVDSAVTRIERGRVDQATPLLREAAGLEPGLAASLRTQGLELARNGDPRRARLVARAADLLEGTDPN